MSAAATAAPTGAVAPKIVFRLRAASVVATAFAAGHTLGGLKSWSPPMASPALDVMRSYRFEAEGVRRTLLDFYRGFGFSLSVYMLLQAIVLWQLADIARERPDAVKPIVGAFAVASLALAGLALTFIMPVPAVFSIALTACLVAAWFAG